MLGGAATKGAKVATVAGYRRGKAIMFYRANGMSLKRTLSHIKGINFKYPVQKTNIKAGTNLIQYQQSGHRMGQYFTEPGISAAELGIYTNNRKAILYQANKGDVSALKTIAADMTDKHTLPGFEIKTKGGGVQYFCPETSSFVNRYRIVPRKID